jgi:hypothetical protein
MSKIDKETMFEIADKVVANYREKLDPDFVKNPYFESFFTAVSDIAAMVVWEYHKLLMVKINI